MIFEIRKRIAREDQSGTGHAGAEALCREWGIRLRFLAPPPPPRLLFFEATDGALGWIGGSPSPAVEVRSPSAEEAPPSPPSSPVEVSSPANIVVTSQHHELFSPQHDLEIPPTFRYMLFPSESLSCRKARKTRQRRDGQGSTCGSANRGIRLESAKGSGINPIHLRPQQGRRMKSAHPASLSARPVQDPALQCSCSLWIRLQPADQMGFRSRIQMTWQVHLHL
jgi:hypothetical protein